MRTSDYRRRELAVLEQLAWSTINDPKATDQDRREARARLEGAGQCDLERLTPDELDAFEHLLGKAYGHEPSAHELGQVETAAGAIVDASCALAAPE